MRLALLTSVAAVALAAGPARAEDVPNPDFVNWSKFPKGTSVTTRTAAVIAGSKTVIVTTRTLVEIGADKVVIETEITSTANGKEFKPRPTKRDLPKTVPLPAGVKPEDFAARKPAGTSEEGTETIKVGGAEYKTKWYKYKFGGIDTKIWVSDEVPGSIVRTEVKPDSASDPVVVEVTEIKKP